MHKLNRLFTVALSVTATAGFALYGCQSLWDSQLVADPNNCVVNNIPCERGFVCDVDTKHCVPAIGDMAGVDASGSDIDGGTMIDLSSIDMAIDPSPFVVQSTSNNTAETLNAVYGKSGGQVWAAGEKSTLLSLENNAKSWQLRSPSGVPQPTSYNSVWTFDGNEVWLGGSSFIGALSMPTLSLRNALNAGVNPSIVVAAWGYDAVNVFFTDNSDRVYMTNSLISPVKVNGCNATEMSNLTQSLWGLDETRIWTVGTIKAPYSSVKKITKAQCGVFNSVLNGPPGVTFSRIHGVDATKIWLTAGTNVYTLNSELPLYAQQAVPSTKLLNGIWAISTTDVWAVGDSGTIIHYNGTKWDAVLAPIAKSGVNFRAVWAANANDVYIVGDGGTILKKYK